MTNTNPKIISAVRLIQKCLFVRKDGKILALRRDPGDHSRSGAWDLPGGGYERGEDVIEAIKREVQEEAGIIANSLFPFYFANKVGTKKGLFAGENVFAICYVCRDWGNALSGASGKEGDIQLSEEHVEYQWVTPQEFAQLDFAQDDGFFAAAIETYLNQFASSSP